MRLTAWRITKTRFAATIWSGVGARLYGGRWNSKGVAVVYAADSRALAAFEQLVHLDTPRGLRGYVIASISFDAAEVQRLDVATLPRRWNNANPSAALKKLGDDWIAAGHRAVLAVPSAVIPGEWNYLINPTHPRFSLMIRSKPVPFAYDSRLA